MHSPHLNFRLGHDRTRVSAVPKTATQTPISVSSASVDKVCDWPSAPASEACRAISGMVAAKEVSLKWTTKRTWMKGQDIVSHVRELYLFESNESQ